MNRYEFYTNLECFKKNDNDSSLEHYGILGQKWGTRRWQNADGTFNEEGKVRYFGSQKAQNELSEKEMIKKAKREAKIDKKAERSAKWFKRTVYYKDFKDIPDDFIKDMYKDFYNNPWYKRNLAESMKRTGDAWSKNMENEAKKLNDIQKKQQMQQMQIHNQMVQQHQQIVNQINLQNHLQNHMNMVNTHMQMHMNFMGQPNKEQKVGGTNYTWDRMDNIYKYNDKYQNADGTLTKKGQKLLDKGKNTEDLINMDLYNKSKYTEDDWNKAIEESNKQQNEIVANAKAKVNTNKELSSKDINEKEFKDIINELNDFNMRDFYKNHRDEYNDVADIGMDALNKSDNYGADCKIGDDGDREWFMWEDQTIGNPEVAYLYYKGYSKDYIKQYLSKPLPDSLAEMEDNDPYAHAFFVRDEFYRGGDAYIDALFDKNDQKIGGLFSKDENKKAEKEGKKLNDELSKANWAEKTEIRDRIIKDPKYKDLFDEIDEIDKEKSAKSLARTEEIFNDFEDNETLNLATAGITNMFANGYYKNPTMEDMANCAWFYAYEDGNQGDNTAEYLYSTIDKGVSSKELNQLYEDLHVKKEMRNEGVKHLNENPTLKNIDDKQLDAMIDKKLQNKYQDNTSYWDLYAANSGSKEPSTEVKKAYSDAKKIAKKLESSCSNSDGWDFLNEAIENLGLSSTELKNMTQSDWDKLNAEVNRLKK